MAFYGMRGTGDWVANQMPENWNEAILYWFPNGDAPLTAIMSKMQTKPLDSPVWHWWTQGLPSHAADITGVYSDAGLSVAYVSGAAIGAMIYVKMTAADIMKFIVSHQVILRDASDMSTDCIGLVVDRVESGSSSYVQVKLLEADDNSGDSHTLANADRILAIGSANEEGAGMPDSISYDPTEWYNYTQILRTPLEITGTAMETNLRTNPQAYAKLQKETLQDHSILLEKNTWWSIPSVGTGANGKPIRTTMGIIPAIKGGYLGHGGASGTVDDYVLNTDYAGQTWLSGGADWLDEQLEIIFRYGKKMKLAFCGSLTVAALNKLVQNGGDYSWGPDTTLYGMAIKEWKTPFGSIGLIMHPLFNYETTTRRIMVIIEPENLVYRPLRNRDTKFIGEGIAQTNTGYTRRDGIKEEYLTERGIEYQNPNGWGYLYGFGLDNTAS